MTDALKAELAERIAARRVLVVVGTGVSLVTTGGEKLASWKGLIASGIGHCVELGLRDAKWADQQKGLLESDLDDFLIAAEQVSRRLSWKLTEPCGGDWNGWLRKTVGSLHAKHPELIQAIRDLGTPIATLNYDSLLMEVTGRRPLTWRQAERWLPVLEGKDEAILHLHGHWDQPSSVVLGIRSYDAVLGKDLAQHLQRALASLQSLAFIGCSGTLEDPNFSALLAWMRGTLSGAEHRHYLLLREGEPLTAPEPQLREARIVPLRYSSDHTDLLSYLRSLAPKPALSMPGSSIVNKSSEKMEQEDLCLAHDNSIDLDQSLPYNFFVQCASNALEECVDLYIGATQASTYRRIDLISEIYCGEQLLSNGRNRLVVRVRRVRLRLETEACDIAPGRAFGDNDDHFNSMQSDQKKPFIISRKNRKLWEICASGFLKYLNGRILGDEEPIGINIDEISRCMVVAIISIYPNDFDLELLRDDGSGTSLNVSDMKIKIIKLLIRKSLGRKNDEIILSRCVLQPREVHQ